MSDLKNKLLKLEPKVGNTIFIAIDGNGGSGKSTLAEKLSKELNAEKVCTDDFASWDNPTNWHPLVIQYVFNPIKSGSKTLSYPKSQWWENHSPEPVTNQPVTKIMILEGVSSLRQEFREYISFGIYVNTPREECRRRGLERDAETGKSAEEIERLWQEWFDREDGYAKRDNPQEYADVVVSGTIPFEEQVELIARYSS